MFDEGQSLAHQTAVAEAAVVDVSNKLETLDQMSDLRPESQKVFYSSMIPWEMVDAIVLETAPEDPALQKETKAKVIDILDYLVADAIFEVIPSEQQTEYLSIIEQGKSAEDVMSWLNSLEHTLQPEQTLVSSVTERVTTSLKNIQHLIETDSEVDDLPDAEDEL
jgi:uncharacterized protein YjgD (DUF1641 family)